MKTLRPLHKPAIAAALAVTATAATAQSSVTLSGVADAATRMVRNEGLA